MTLSILLAALIAIESGGDPSAIGDGGKAVGCLQIHPVMVADCNRILAGRGEAFRYTIDDRYSEAHSRAMAVIYLRHYCPNGSAEQMARCWNGGPMGARKAATVGYWRKVKRQMEVPSE